MGNNQGDEGVPEGACETRSDNSVHPDDMAQEVAANGRRSVDRLFAGEVLDPPVVIWQPMASDLPVKPLPFLLDYWHDLPRVEDLPLANAVDALSLGPALGDVMLLDVIDQGQDFRYRVYGSKIAEGANFDMTGRLTSEIQTSRYVSIFFLAIYRAAMIRREPVYTRHNPPVEVSAKTWDRLILPLAGKSGPVERILVGNVAGRWRSTLGPGV